MKKINCLFLMSGTYRPSEKSVCAARRKAMENMPLPEDRSYIDDSLTVDDLADCMIANGWDPDVVAELSLLSPEALIRTLDFRCQKSVETVPDSSYTTTQIKAFLLDYYDIEYEYPRKAELQSEKKALSTKKCFIVVRTNYADDTDAYAFGSEEDAKKSIDENIKTTERNLVQQGYQPERMELLEGIEVYVPDTDIYYMWRLISSTISTQDISSVPSPIPHLPERNAENT